MHHLSMKDRDVNAVIVENGKSMWLYEEVIAALAATAVPRTTMSGDTTLRQG